DSDCHTPLPREVRKHKDTTPRACSLHAQGGPDGLLVGLMRGEILPSRCNQPAAGRLRRLRDRGGDRHQRRKRAAALFQARREGAGAAIWEVHALGSALGMGPKARMGEKPAASSRLVIVITVLISGEPRVSATSTISIPPRGLRPGMWGHINKS